MSASGLSVPSTQTSLGLGGGSGGWVGTATSDLNMNGNNITSPDNLNINGGSIGSVLSLTVGTQTRNGTINIDTDTITLNSKNGANQSYLEVQPTQLAVDTPSGQISLLNGTFGVLANGRGNTSDGFARLNIGMTSADHPDNADNPNIVANSEDRSLFIISQGPFGLTGLEGIGINTGTTEGSGGVFTVVGGNLYWNGALVQTIPA